MTDPLLIVAPIAVACASARWARFAFSAQARLEWRDERAKAWLERDLPVPCEVVGHEYTFNPDECDWCGLRLSYEWIGHPLGCYHAWSVTDPRSGSEFWTDTDNVADQDPSRPRYKGRAILLDAQAKLWQPGVAPRQPFSTSRPTTPREVAGKPLTSPR